MARSGSSVSLWVDSSAASGSARRGLQQPVDARRCALTERSAGRGPRQRLADARQQRLFGPSSILLSDDHRPVGPGSRAAISPSPASSPCWASITHSTASDSGRLAGRVQPCARSSGRAPCECRGVPTNRICAVAGPIPAAAAASSAASVSPRRSCGPGCGSAASTCRRSAGRRCRRSPIDAPAAARQTAARLVRSRRRFQHR